MSTTPQLTSAFGPRYPLWEARQHSLAAARTAEAALATPDSAPRLIQDIEKQLVAARRLGERGLGEAAVAGNHHVVAHANSALNQLDRGLGNIPGPSYRHLATQRQLTVVRDAADSAAALLASKGIPRPMSGATLAAILGASSAGLLLAAYAIDNS